MHESLLDYSQVDEIFASLYILPASQITILWLARWCEQGFPRIVWDNPKFPAMLMASKADPSVIEFARPPWKAFLVDLPKDILYTNDVNNKNVALERVLIQIMKYETEEKWNFLIQGKEVEIWRHGISIEQLVDLTDAKFHQLFIQGLDDRDKRTMVLIGRLIVGLCLTLSDPSRMRESKQTKSKKRTYINKKYALKMKNFVVGHPVIIDCRQDIKNNNLSTSDKKGSPATVRTLVRGHWKSQPHGPKNSFRKLIFREPYWRGPENSPIIKRDHIIKTEEGQI
jgi:hypothetical protein